MFKQDLIRELSKYKRLDKDLVVVANTYQNISNEELIKKLELLNAFVNKKLFRYFQKYPDKRVMFICSIERVRNNTHSHILLRIPKEYDRNYVLKLMSKSFKRLGDRFKLFNEPANNEIGNVIYSLKGHHSKYVPEQLVVI
jgi:hypothetical protein